MALEKLGKVLGSIANTTAKKATEQVQITKLGIDRASIERQIEGVYAAMGRFCYSRCKAGDALSEELREYCRDVDLLVEQIAALDDEIAQRKAERDAADYSAATEFAAEILPRRDDPAEASYTVAEEEPTPEAEPAPEAEPEKTAE